MTASLAFIPTAPSPPNLAGMGFNPFTPGEAVGLTWVDLIAHRDYLVRFAKRRLHDPSLAEDVVHDVFEAVIGGRAVFGGRAAVKSWLTAVLKNKIVDLIRQRGRFDSLDGHSTGEDDAETQQWECHLPRPDEVAEQRQRCQQTLKRISDLPQGLRDVIQLRVIEEESSQAVCKRLRISESNLFVRLHRARKQLLC